jgi:phage-related holin
MLSIVENLGLAGIPMPEAIVKALEQLQSKSESTTA